MKRIIIFSVLLCSVINAEDIFLQPCNQKSSTNKLKINLAQSLEATLHDASSLIKELATLIEEVAQSIKELAGEQNGTLTKANKDILRKKQQHIDELQLMLNKIKGQLHV